MPGSLQDALVRLLGGRVAITLTSGQTLTGNLSAVVDGLAILAVGGNTCYLAIRDINSVCTTEGGML